MRDALNISKLKCLFEECVSILFCVCYLLCTIGIAVDVSDFFNFVLMFIAFTVWAEQG